MKRRLASTLLFLLLASSLSWAQSSMTDDQIFQFAVKEQKAGTSQQQIVTKLMQRGGDINQIRRVKRKLERETKQTGLGVVSNVGTNNNDRTRKANTQTDELASENADKYTSGMILDNRYQSKRRTYDE